jgi:hypothetical protein
MDVLTSSAPRPHLQRSRSFILTTHPQPQLPNNPMTPGFVPCTSADDVLLRSTLIRDCGWKENLSQFRTSRDVSQGLVKTIRAEITCALIRMTVASTEGKSKTVTTETADFQHPASHPHATHQALSHVKRCRSSALRSIRRKTRRIAM